MIPLDPVSIGLIIQGFSAAIAAAPQVAALVKKAKDYVTALFKAKLIARETQNAIFMHLDEVCAAAMAGETPPHWKVEADPV